MRAVGLTFLLYQEDKLWSIIKKKARILYFVLSFTIFLRIYTSKIGLHSWIKRGQWLKSARSSVHLLQKLFFVTILQPFFFLYKNFVFVAKKWRLFASNSRALQPQSGLKYRVEKKIIFVILASFFTYFLQLSFLYFIFYFSSFGDYFYYHYFLGRLSNQTF